MRRQSALSSGGDEDTTSTKKAGSGGMGRQKNIPRSRTIAVP